MPTDPNTGRPSGGLPPEGEHLHLESQVSSTSVVGYCGQCGESLMAAARFCGACGSPRQQVRSLQPEWPQAPVPGGCLPTMVRPELEPYHQADDTVIQDKSTHSSDRLNGNGRKVSIGVGIGVSLIAVLLAFQLGSAQSSTPPSSPGSTSGSGGNVSNSAKTAACARVQTLQSQLNAINNEIGSNLGNLTNGSNSVYRAAQSNLDALRTQAATLRSEISAQNSVCQGH